MTKKLTKVVSLVCTFTLLLTLCVCAFSTAATAAAPQEQTTELVNYNFDDGKGIAGVAHGTSDHATSLSSGNISVIDDPTVGSTHGKVVELKRALAYSNFGTIFGIAKDKTKDNFDASNNFTIEAGKIYKIQFDYNYLSGCTSQYFNAYANAPHSLAMAVYLTKSNITYGGDTARSRVLRMAIEELPSNKITADLGWKTAVAYYYAPVNDSVRTTLSIGMDFSSNHSTFGTVLVDNLIVSEVTSLKENSSSAKTYNYGATTAEVGEFNADGDKAIIKHYVKGQASSLSPVIQYDVANSLIPTVSEDGVKVKIKSKLDYTKASGWFQKFAIVDLRNQYSDANYGAVLVKPNTAYEVTLKYKVLSLGGATKAYIALANTYHSTTVASAISSDASTPFTSGNPHMFKYIQRTETPGVTTDWQTMTWRVTSDDLDIGSYLAFVLGTDSATATAEYLINSVTVKTLTDEDGVANLTTAKGEGTGTDTTVFVGKGKYTLPANPFTAPAGKYFAGWQVGGTTYAAGDEIDITADTTITAVYSSITYDVQYLAGANGTGTAATDKKVHGTDLTLKGAIFTRQNFTQVGWATTDGGAKAYDLGAKYTANAALTLYPVWADKVYNVTVTGGSANSNTNIAGSTVTLTAAPAANQLFVNWEVVSGNFTLDNAKDATTTFVMPGENVSVKAVYKTKVAAPYASTDKTDFEWTGSEIALELDTYDANAITVTGNKGTAYGETYTLKMVLKDKVNYCWADGTTDDITINWTISHTHDLTRVPAKEAGCTDGNIEYWTCACGNWYSDDAATTAITDKNSVVIKANADHADLNKDGKCDACQADLEIEDDKKEDIKTGDASNLILWIVIAVVSISAAVVVLFKKERA